MRAAPIALLVVLVGLSGCAEEAPPPSGPTDASGNLVAPPINFTLPAEPLSLDVAFNAQGCHAGQLWVEANDQLIAGKMPDGFDPAPSRDLVAPRGGAGALASLETFVCDSSSLGAGPLAFGAFLVYVEPPPFGEGLEAADTNWYQFSLYSEAVPLLTALGSVNATASQGAATNEVTASPYAKSAGQASDEEGVLFTYETVSVLTKPNAPFTRRVWHKTSDGLVRIDYAYQADIIDGTGKCDVREGSMITDGQVGCGSEDILAGLSWTQASWTGRILYTPDPA